MDDVVPATAAEIRLQDRAAAGCAESRLLISRRTALGISAALFSSAYVPKFAEAATVTDPRLLVVVLRGGMDGINTVVPYGDPAYAGMRGDLAIAKEQTLPLDSFFGLHPAMPNFATYYADGEAAIIPATCVPLRNRSHFDAQDNLENGLPGLASNPTGWLNRLLTVLPTSSPILERGAMQIGSTPLILKGPAPVLGWSPTWFDDTPTHVSEQILKMYAASDSALYDVLDRGLRANQLAEAVTPDTLGDLTPLRKAFVGAGHLLAADTGPRIAVMSVDNFDTHVTQGVLDGQLFDVLKELDDGLADFRTAVGDAWSNTVVLMVSEFGRTVRVNGDKGTDHGVGTATLLAGGAVEGGRIVGDWPGLSEANLYEGSDLMPVIDLRSVFKGVLEDHIGVPSSVLNATVFPGSLAAPSLKDLVKVATQTQNRKGERFRRGAGTRGEPSIAAYRAARLRRA